MNRPSGILQEIVNDNAVLDYALVRQSGYTDSEKNLFLYVVPGHKLDDKNALFKRVEGGSESAGKALLDSHIQVCFVSCIPRDNDGNVQYLALQKTPSFDVPIEENLKEYLQAQLHTNDIAVLKLSGQVKPEPYHLIDLFPASANEKGGLKSSAIAQVPSDIASEKPSELEQNASKVPALATGGKIIGQDTDSLTLVQAFQETVKKHANVRIHYLLEKDREYSQTYAELWHNALLLLGGLQLQGLKPGDYVILQIAHLEEHFSAFWACVLGGFIPVTVAVPSNPNDAAVIQKLKHTVDLLKGASILINKELSNYFESGTYWGGAANYKFLHLEQLKTSQRMGSVHSCAPEDVIFHQLTSGSTGSSKSVQITHKGVVAHIRGIAQFNQYSHKNVSLNWLPMDHVAPILMFHLKDLYLGIRQVVVKTELILANPLLWLECLEKYRVTHSWAPNFGFKLVIDALNKARSTRQYKLQHVEEIMNAGEQVTLPVLEEFLRATRAFGLKDRVIQPSYGMAETCTAITYRNDFDLQDAGLFHHAARIQNGTLGTQQAVSQAENKGTIFVDLGKPIPGIEIRIVNKKGILSNEGQVGHLHARGDVITPGYFNNPEANERAYYSDGWFDTGDIGFIWQGALTLTGREKETIVIQGANYYCYDIETVVEKCFGVKTTYVGACGVRDPHTNSESLAIFFCAEAWCEGDLLAQLIRSIKKDVALELGISPRYVYFLDEKTFPKTTSGKIQRGRLKNDFEQGVFQSQIRENDILLRNDDTLPAWFYTFHWHRCRGQISQLNSIENLVLLDNGDEFARDAYHALTFLGCMVNRVFVDAGDATDFVTVLDDLSLKNKASYILYFANNFSEAPPSDTLDDPTIRCLIKAFGSLNNGSVTNDSLNSTVNLYFVTRTAQKVLPDDSVAPAQALIPALVRVIGQELPNIHACHLDFDAESTADARHLVSEIMLDKKPRQVAFRKGRRYVLGLRPLALSNFKQQDPPPLLVNGFYIVTGGLGGVGKQVSQLLLNEFQMKLLILGRSPREQVEDSESWRELSSLGAVVYRQMDHWCQKRLDDLVKELIETFACSLQGVFHLAGVYRSLALQDESASTFKSATEAKVAATNMLVRTLQANNPQGLFVGFSSVLSFFGGAYVGAYAAGNRYLENVVRTLRDTTALKSFCLVWSYWDNLGMSQGYRSSSSQGFEFMRSKQALYSMLAALKCDEAVTVIGLDPSQTYISKHFNQAPEPLCRLLAFYPRAGVDETGRHIGAKSLATFTDQGGATVPCQVIPLDVMPMTMNGEVDIAILRERFVDQASMGVKNYARNGCEKILVGLWQEALEEEVIGIDDNFFEVGGNSISMTVLLAKMARAFAREFTIMDFFNYPNIKQMAKHIEENRIEPATTKTPAVASRRKQLEKRLLLKKQRSALSE